MSSCEYCKILNNTFSTEHLQTTASLVKVYRVKVSAKDKGLTRKKLRHRYLPWKLLRVLKVLLDCVFQTFITADKNIFNISNKIISIVSVDAFTLIWGDIFHALDLKSEVFAGISFRKVLGICYKQDRNLQ